VPVAGSPATLFRAHQASACPASMMPLSEDWTALNNKVDAMTPTGNTNVTIGMAMPMVTLVLPVGVMASTLLLSAVQFSDSGII